MAFDEKRNALFACLDDASRELKGTSLDQTVSGTDSAKVLRRSSSGDIKLFYRNDGYVSSSNGMHLKHLRGKESIFKKPSLPIGRCLRPRKTPDYEVNPHKWTKYSLEDLDTSENSNTSAALAFLNEMDRRKENSADEEEKKQEEMSMDTEKKIPPKIEFKKSSTMKRNLKNLESNDNPDPDLDKVKFKGSKLVMPEYIVGQKSRTTKAKPRPKQPEEAPANSLKLTHLMEEEEEEE